MNKIQFNLHQRNYHLEKEIDLLSYRDLNVRNHVPGTLGLFMDSLFNLLHAYEETGSELDQENIEEFLCKRASSIPYVDDLFFRRWHNSLSNEQFDYLKGVLKYIDGLRFAFRAKQKNTFDVIRFIKKECSLELYRGTRLEHIMLFASSYISKCNLQGYYVETKNGVGYIGFHGIQHEIMVIPDWCEVKNDNSHYHKTLIVQCEISEITSNFLKVNKSLSQ